MKNSFRTSIESLAASKIRACALSELSLRQGPTWSEMSIHTWNTRLSICPSSKISRKLINLEDPETQKVKAFSLAVLEVGSSVHLLVWEVSLKRWKWVNNKEDNQKQRKVASFTLGRSARRPLRFQAHIWSQSWSRPSKALKKWQSLSRNGRVGLDWLVARKGLKN